MPPTFITREELKRRCLEKWAPAIELARELKLIYLFPKFNTAANRELEFVAYEQFGGELDSWVIIGWCPVFGYSCNYLYYASKTDLHNMMNILLASKGLSAGRRKIIADELQIRPEYLPDDAIWVNREKEYDWWKE